MRAQSFGLIAALVVLALFATLPVQAQPEPVQQAPVFVQQVQGGPDVSVSGAQGQPSHAITQRPAYFIWYDGEGFHVQWSARSAGTRQFRGEIATDGTISAFRGDQLENEDNVRRGRDTITWEATAAEGVDGFVFSLGNSADWVRFTLMLDGRLIIPQQIFIGNRGFNPGGNPFVFQVREAGGDRDRWPAAYRGQPRTQGVGYYVWVDNNIWHVRWNGRGLGREVSGLISTDGQFSNFRRVEFEQGDEIAQSSRLIAWQTANTDKTDGISFRTSGDQLTFTLLVDGDSVNVGRIFTGASGGHPARNPFRVRR